MYFLLEKLIQFSTFFLVDQKMCIYALYAHAVIFIALALPELT